MQAELERKAGPTSHKSGVCLEYLRGTCQKGNGCRFSHTLKDYYAHVCKHKPHVSVAKCSISESLLAALVAGQPNSSFEQAMLTAERCQRSYVLRCMIPTMIPGDSKRAEALIAALVRPSFSCLSLACLGVLPKAKPLRASRQGAYVIAIFLCRTLSFSTALRQLRSQS
jgi:hypothetical protein